jgi:mRNA interferase RelE/StbE
MSYRLRITPEFDRAMTRLPENEQKRLWGKIESHIARQLKNEPHFGTNIKKLKDFHPETWRFRIGNYRLFYIIDEAEHIVSLTTLSLRKDAY